MNKYQSAYYVIDTVLHLMCGEEREDGYRPTQDELIKAMEDIKDLVDKTNVMINREETILQYLEEYKNEVAMEFDCDTEEYFYGQYVAIKQIIERVKEIIESEDI